MLIPVLIGMTLVVFSIIRFIPGNPAQVILGQRATKEAVQQLTVQLGLDQPWYMQYARYIGDLLKGDLGTSIRTGAAITQEIKPYLFATLELAFFAMLIAVFVGVNALNHALMIPAFTPTNTAISIAKKASSRVANKYGFISCVIAAPVRIDVRTSIRTGAAITQEIKPYLFATLELAFFAMLIAVFVGVNAGIISAWFKAFTPTNTAISIAKKASSRVANKYGFISCVIAAPVRIDVPRSPFSKSPIYLAYCIYHG